MWMSSCEGSGACPERWKGAGIVKNVHIEAVFQIIVTHEPEDVVVNVAEIVNLASFNLSEDW